MAANIGVGPATAWDLCRALLPLAVGEGTIVAGVVDERSWLARRLRESVDPADLFLHASCDPTLLVGDVDRDCTPRRETWPGVDHIEPRRIRRLDTMYSGSHRIGLLVVSGHPDPATVLRSAADLLGSNPPCVVLDLAAVEQGSRTAAILSIAQLLPNWRWFDSLLLVLGEPDDAARLVENFAESVFAIVPAEVLPSIGVDNVRSLALSGWRLPVRPDRSGQVTIRPDQAFRSDGFYQPEVDGDHVWRWSGPDRGARAYLPVPAYGAWYVDVEIFSWGALEGPHDVWTALNGARLQPTAGREGGFRAGLVKVLPGTSAAYIRLDLVCARMRAASFEDSRTLGLCISGFVLDRQE